MIYTSSLGLKSDCDQGLRKFCDLTRLVGQPHQLTLFAELVQKEDPNFFNRKFTLLAQKIKELVALAELEVKSRHPKSYQPGLIQVIDRRESNSASSKLAGIKLFYRIGEETGICLSLRRAPRICYLTFWLRKFSAAKRYSEAFGFPEPTSMPDWSVSWPHIEPVVVNKPVPVQVPTVQSLGLLGSTRIPMGDIVDLIMKHSKR